MNVRDALLAVLMLFAAGLVAWGVRLWSVPAGYVAAGVLLAAVAFLFLADDGSGAR
jgi:hypothetical protein